MSYLAEFPVRRQIIQAPSGGYVPNRVFVGGLRLFTSNRTLHEYFSKFGKVTTVFIARHYTTVSRGFGFITFSSPLTAERVVNHPMHIIDGKRIEVKRAYPYDPTSHGRKLFFGGITQDTTYEDTMEYFGRFGIIERIEMSFEPVTGGHRGFGYVTFEREDVAALVYDIHYHWIKGKSVECQKMFPRRVRDMNFMMANPAFRHFRHY